MLRFILLIFALQLVGHEALSQDHTAFSFRATFLPSKYELKNGPLNNPLPLPLVRPYHYGAICRWESTAMQLTKVPLAFRLGSADQVRRLEHQYVVNYGPRTFRYRP